MVGTEIWDSQNTSAEAKSTLPSENELEAMIDEIPGLITVRDFAVAMTTVNWFSAIGDRASPDLIATARSYLDALGFPHVDIAWVQDWETAEAAAESLDWDTAGWEAEEQLRASLAGDALDLMEEEALTVALAHVRAKTAGALEDLMEDFAALWDLEDKAFINAAAGAAIQAAHNKALVILAQGPDDHPFSLKFSLFENGRWPIALAGSSFNLF